VPSSTPDPTTRLLAEVPPAERLSIARKIAGNRLPAELAEEGAAAILWRAELLLSRRPDAPLAAWLATAVHEPAKVARAAEKGGGTGKPRKLVGLDAGDGDGVVVADTRAVIPGSDDHLATLRFVDAEAIRVAAQAVEAWCRHLSGPRGGERVADAVVAFRALVAVGTGADDAQSEAAVAAYHSLLPHRSRRARALLTDALEAAASGAAPPEDLTLAGTNALDLVRDDVLGV